MGYETIKKLKDTEFKRLTGIKPETYRMMRDILTRDKKLSRRRILVKNVIGKLKFFRIPSEQYRNRRKPFSLRFNLIAAIYNFELLPNQDFCKRSN